MKHIVYATVVRTTPFAPHMRRLKKQHSIVLFLSDLFSILQVLLFPLPLFLCILQVVIVRFGREPHGFDAVVVDVEAESNALVVCFQGFVGPINVSTVVALHITFLMIDSCLDHTIMDSLWMDI